MSVCDVSPLTVLSPIFKSFNPCFNGCRSAILYRLVRSSITTTVSILVLMDVGLRSPPYTNYTDEDWCFNPCFNGCRSAMPLNQPGGSHIISFNPCFNGCRSAIGTMPIHGWMIESFNPCFNGCRSAMLP